MSKQDKYSMPETWATPDQFDKLMQIIGHAFETGYLTEDSHDELDLPARCLLYAWQQGTIRIERPLETGYDKLSQDWRTTLAKHRANSHRLVCDKAKASANAQHRGLSVSMDLGGQDDTQW